ncbi:MAG TPA: hypothetical protein VNN74_01940 [Candidatus Micrarchaeia archaeon]|nr:hypothetical protein [Candidatus Micrarchaeia archaeon]
MGASIRVRDPLAALVRSASAQQVNLAWAATTRRRPAETLGERRLVGGWTVRRLVPERLAEAGPEGLRRLQIPRQKARAVVGLAEAQLGRRLALAELERLGDDQLGARPGSLHGIGGGSAAGLRDRTLGRPRAVAGDLGVRTAVGRAYLGQARPAEDDVRRAVRHWDQAALVAPAVLLHGLARGRLPQPPAGGGGPVSGRRPGAG